MQELLTAFGNGIAEHWISVVSSLLVGWFLLRQQFIRAEHKTIKEDIEFLKGEQIKINTILGNVTKNQKIIRADVKETNTDVKKLLARRKEDYIKRKRWWQV